MDEKAYRMGAKLDAWREYFSFDTWMNAAAEINLPINNYLANYDVNSTLPWDHISYQIDRDFLVKELKKAELHQTTSDCRISGCTGCGVCNTTKNGFIICT